MCGIAGIFTATDKSRAEVIALAATMGGAIRHRGPDGGAEWVTEDGRVALAHRRLSIIDLSAAGNQPMVSHCGRYVLAYNGEVFNFPYLRSLVEAARGPVAWCGHSDTEVVLEAIATFGVERAVSLCNGMFALAVWDKEQSQLVLGRDRLGKKPLYAGYVGKDFVFASEIAAIRKHPDWRFRPDRTAIASFLRTGYVPEPLSAFEGIEKVPSGATVTLGRADIRQSRVPSAAPYWKPRAPSRDSQETKPEELDKVLKDAVASRLVADVPLGAFLSGGVDSTIVTAIMKNLAGSVRTFTIGFDDSDSSEIQHARAVARYLGTSHSEMVLSPGQAMDLVPRVVAAYDEPFADVSAIPTWLVSQLAAKDVKVVLSGDGADENFGGYVRYQQNENLWRARSILFPPVPAVLGVLGGSLMSSVAASRPASILWALCGRDVLEFYRRRTSFFPDPSVLLPGVQEITPVRLQTVAVQRSVVRTMMAADLVTYLPDDILVKVDRASMAHGLEVRSPFLDDEVVDFAWRLPDSFVTNKYAGKRILREYLYGLVPRELVDRPKTGFGFPVEQWLRGKMRDWAESTLRDSRWVDVLGICPEAVGAVWKGLLGGRLRLGGAVWNLLMLAAWVKRQESSVEHAD